jgi:hypothetical protein
MMLGRCSIFLIIMNYHEGYCGMKNCFIQGQMLLCNCDIHSIEVGVVLYLQLRGICLSILKKETPWALGSGCELWG